MAWRVANSLTTYIRQINTMAPGRDRASDGTIGDAAHQAEPSDHNPRLIPGCGPVPLVTAADVTHDPGRGCDMGAVSEQLRLSRDGRIKYVIFNRRMFSSYASGGVPAWTWRPYSGSNPHTHHGHLSVVGDARADDTRPWQIAEDDMALDEDRLHQAADITIWNLRPWLEGLVHAQASRAAADEARDNAVLTAVQALANAGGVDAAPIVAAIVASRDQVLEQVARLIEDLQAERARGDRLAAALATAGGALAAADDPPAGG